MLQEKEVSQLGIEKILGGNIGFCSMYTLWYIDTRLSFPDKLPKDIVEKISL